MAFVGGYVDVIGFVLLLSACSSPTPPATSSCSASALAGDASGLATKLLALPVFIGASALTYALIRWRNARGQPCEVLVLALQAALLLVFMLLTARALPAASANEPAVMLAGLVGVDRHGGAERRLRVVFTHLAPTTMSDRQRHPGGHRHRRSDHRARSSGRGAEGPAPQDLVPPVAAFAFGAVGGAVGVLVAGAWEPGAGRGRGRRPGGAACLRGERS
ncbi:DUF1275 family protein [Caulobacter segnis]